MTNLSDLVNPQIDLISRIYISAITTATKYTIHTFSKVFFLLLFFLFFFFFFRFNGGKIKINDVVACRVRLEEPGAGGTPG